MGSPLVPANTSPDVWPCAHSVCVRVGGPTARPGFGPHPCCLSVWCSKFSLQSSEGLGCKMCSLQSVDSSSVLDSLLLRLGLGQPATESSAPVITAVCQGSRGRLWWQGGTAECMCKGRCSPDRGQVSPVGPGGSRNRSRGCVGLGCYSRPLGKEGERDRQGEGVHMWSHVGAAVSGPYLHGSPASPGQQGP